MDDMVFRWMQTANPGIRCEYMHPGKSCFEHIQYKFVQVVKKSSRFYLSLYIFSFVFFRLRKIKNKKDLFQEIKKFGKNYFGSLMFMGTLVSSIAAYTCFNDRINFKEPSLHWKMYIWGSLFSALSLLCESKSRHQQIVYFIFIRAARSAFTLAKKRGLPNLPSEEKSAFILIYGIISFIYYSNSNLLKNANLFDKIWGKA